MHVTPVEFIDNQQSNYRLTELYIYIEYYYM